MTCRATTGLPRPSTSRDPTDAGASLLLAKPSLVVDSDLDAVFFEAPPYAFPDQVAHGVDAGKHIYPASLARLWARRPLPQAATA